MAKNHPFIDGNKRTDIP
ncbi:MAG: Fic family protein [Bacteroidota bacterium]|nr:Fic family protein [Bacteroidota bacterium]